MATKDMHMEKAQTQRTVALLRVGQKDKVLPLIREAGLCVVLDKELVSNQHIKTLLSGQVLTGWTSGQPLHALILEGPDAVQCWLAIAKTEKCYGSPTVGRARRQATYIQGLVVDAPASEAGKNTARKPSVQPSLAKPKTTQRQSLPTRTASPAKKPAAADTATKRTTKAVSRQSTSASATNGKQAAVPPSRVPVRSTAGRATPTSASKKLSTTGGVSKPPKSVITGRPRRGSRVEKRKDVVVPDTISNAPQEAPQEASQDVTQDTLVDQPIQPDAEPLTQPPTLQSLAESVTTSSCVDREENEHDAEVAATTTRQETYTPPPALDDTTPSARASFSPNSVSSLPRPETPEVDQLRMRFEALAHTPKPAERPRYGISPEVALKVKEMKPKSPAGARVKSMVEFFMDENLHKWEF